MRIRRKPMSKTLKQPNKKLRYIDPLKVKRLIGGFFPSDILAKLIDVDLVALNDEATIRMGGGGIKPLYLSKEYNSTVIGVVDEMEKYNHKLVSHWICPYISRHLLSLNPLQARCRRYSRGER
ncbi:hypothetical protein [Escherichia coli]|uniref:hypothetical protein n=1 Tax=Escherichia coli TaxID=562 RepID=UPI0011400B78|nr:hypothetical protein [Escherichia coli]